MGLVGFKCPRDGLNRPFDYCFNSCVDSCEPLPLLTDLARVSGDDGKFHVSTIWQPYRNTLLKQLYDYYQLPEDLVWATLGTSFHDIMYSHSGADHIKDRYTSESEFNITIDTKYGPQILTGRPDLKDEWHKILWDWKLASFWLVKKIKNKPLEIWDKETTYHLQLNTYRVYDMPNAKEMRLKVLVRDHTKRVQAEGVNKMETLIVPKIEDNKLKQMVKERIEYLIWGAKNIDKVMDCQPHETWGGNRCLVASCPNNKYCPQIRKRRDIE